MIKATSVYMYSMALYSTSTHDTHLPIHNQYIPSVANGLACTLTFRILVSVFGLFFLSTSNASNLSNVPPSSAPSITLPNTVCFPSKWACRAYVMKNCEPLVSGLDEAIETIPRALWRRAGRISSAKGAPQMDEPPFPGGEVGSPVWTINVGMLRWMRTLS